MKRLHAWMICRVPTAAAVQLSAVRVSPPLERSAGNLRAVIHREGVRHSPRGLRRLPALKDMPPPRRWCHVDRRAYTAPVLADRSPPEPPSMHPLVGDDIHAPPLVRRRCSPPDHTSGTGPLASFRQPQGQPLPPGEPVPPCLVPLPALSAAQQRHPTVAVAHPNSRPVPAPPTER
jgi:hypothetical protein